MLSPLSSQAQNLPPNPITGQPGYLANDGKGGLAWINIVTGPSSALDCSKFTCDIATALVPLLATTNTWLGANDFGSASFLRFPAGSGQPPAAWCAKLTDVGKVWVRNDAKAPNSSLYVCAQTADKTYTWELAGGGSQSSVAPSAVKGEAASLPAYTADGQLLQQHVVTGQAHFEGLLARLQFKGAAAFAASGSYSCTVRDFSGLSIAARVIEQAGSFVTLEAPAATPNRAFEFECIGR